VEHIRHSFLEKGLWILRGEWIIKYVLDERSGRSRSINNIVDEEQFCVEWNHQQEMMLDHLAEQMGLLPTLFQECNIEDDYWKLKDIIQAYEESSEEDLFSYVEVLP
jgi:hypothetical protein